LRLPADDLRLADVPSHTEWWALSGLVVHQPDDAGPSTLWTQTDCAIPEGSEERPPETPPSSSR
ncbi:MAG: hypothetical protein VX000_09470, partial [Myxococcota bacterium]|nr:hypothetical protein [Myxococcota bacterium]